ncbi:uncharacterized protein MONBRDRAFT_17242, partial [Monosiga brevicollis MX1]
MAEKSPHREGVLLKWTNYMKGFQPRYFVLHNGQLSYYKNKDEVNHTCRGTLILIDAEIDIGLGSNFIIHAGLPQQQGQSYHLRASSEAERSAWLGSLQLAKQLAHNKRASKQVASSISSTSGNAAQLNSSVDLKRSAVLMINESDDDSWSDDDAPVNFDEHPDNKELFRLGV